MVKHLLDPNSQKTHYVLNAKRQRKTTGSTTPFCKLAHESNNHVRHRYSLYEKVWEHQLGRVQTMLNSANNDLFANLLQYIQDPVLEKLAVMYLALSSNTANNLRVLEDFSEYVHDSGQGNHIRMVRLNSRVCFNIKAAIREVVRQIIQGNHIKHTEEKDESEVKEESDIDESDDEKDKEADDETQFEGDGGRISYDFSIVQDWAREYSRKNDSLRIVVVLEDSDGFSNEVINQLVQLFCVYATRTPLKLVMGLSTKNVGNWINSNITSRLRTLVSGCKLVARENKAIGFQVINDILLQNEITPDNPLLLDAQLSLIILSRFENSVNSIDSLITELKFAYMTHFYQLPLAALVDPDFIPAAFHYDALRKLPSFKKHMEYLLFNYKKLGTVADKEKIQQLLTSDAAVLDLFNEAKKTFQKYQNAVMNAVHLVYFLSQGEKHRFQIYKLVTNNQLINSVFLSDVLKRALAYTADQTAQLIEYMNAELRDRIGECIDDDTIALKRRMQEALNGLIDHLTDYLHSNKHVNMKISDNLFNEVLTLNGGTSELDALKPAVTLEENYENLMILVIRPKLRHIIETGLDEPQKYLRNGLIVEKHSMTRLAGPPLSKLYNVYKDAPVNINLWDFFVAFKLSLLRRDIVKELDKGVAHADIEQNQKLKELAQSARNDDDLWNKLVYAWFLQSCSELTSMGFLREKSKGDYVEKMIWKNL